MGDSNLLQRFTNSILGFCLLLTAVACGPAFKTPDQGTIGLGLTAQVGRCEDGSSLASVSAKATQIETAFQFQKVQVSGQAQFSKVGAASAAATVDVVVDAQCLLAQPENTMFMGTDLVESNVQNLQSIFAVSIPAQQVADMEIAAAANACVMGIADSGFVKTSVGNQSEARAAQTNDPDFQTQEHLSFLNFEISNRYFFETDHITEDVVVAVIDTGIDYTHSDIQCNMWPGLGIDIANGDEDPMDDDPLGHGTHVAGLIGACGNNSVGGTGVMPSNVQLMAVKALGGDGSGSLANVVNSISWAVENGADVINMSIEAGRTSPQLTAAVQNAVRNGVVIIGAAGNSSLEVDTEFNIVFPAVESGLGGMIAVGSVDSTTSQRSLFSNFSTSLVEISAPGALESSAEGGSQVDGTGIYSTVPGGNYDRIMGTSQASPLVAGAAATLIAYLKSQGIQYSPDAIEFYLREKATNRNTSLVDAFAEGAVLDLGTLARNVARDESRSSKSTENREGFFFSCP